jgi:hypothetical protein
MSIVVLKKKSLRFQNSISGQGKDGFSLIGGHRNIGSVGPTNLAKSVSRTRFRGTAPMGHGSTNGIYKISVFNSGSCCTNDPSIIKSSVKNNRGAILHQYKWLHSAYPNYWVKSDDSRPEATSQSAYIKVISSRNSVCVENKVNSGIITDSCSENENICKSSSYHIGGRRIYRTFYSKDLNTYPQSCSQYTSTRYLKKNNLPTPDCLKPFPMTLNHNGCDKNYLTPEEAIADGALPSDWMNCLLSYECNKCEYVFNQFTTTPSLRTANIATNGTNTTSVNYIDTLSQKDNACRYLTIDFPFYFFGVNHGDSNGGTDQRTKGLYFCSKFVLGFGDLKSDLVNTNIWDAKSGPAILLGNYDRYVREFYYSGIQHVDNIKYIRIVILGTDHANENLEANPVNYELFIGRDDCFQYIELRVQSQAVNSGTWNITDGNTFKNVFPSGFNALTGGKYVLRSDLFGNNWELFTDRSIDFK